MLSLNKALVKTKFEHDLCDAAFDNLNVKNRLRFNNFAYSIRELTRHILYRLAPDVDIKCCSWYKPTKNENGKVVITRADNALPNYVVMKPWSAANIPMGTSSPAACRIADSAIRRSGFARRHRPPWMRRAPSEQPPTAR